MVRTDFSEIVLPSGSFATFRRPTGADWVHIPSDVSPQLAMLYLIAAVVRLDGSAVSMGCLLEMDLQDLFALQAELNRILTGPRVAVK